MSSIEKVRKVLRNPLHEKSENARTRINYSNEALSRLLWFLAVLF